MYKGGEPHPPRATEGCWGAIPQVTRVATRSSIKQRGEGKKPPRPVSSGKGSSVDSLPTTRQHQVSHMGSHSPSHYTLEAETILTILQVRKFTSERSHDLPTVTQPGREGLKIRSALGQQGVLARHERNPPKGWTKLDDSRKAGVPSQKAAGEDWVRG